MKRYCDYDSLIHYQPGEFSSRYKTNLEGNLKQIKRDTHLSTTTAASFLEGKYETYISTAPLVLYRLYGRYNTNTDAAPDQKDDGSPLVGRFVSTEFAESCIDAKLRLALKPGWKNTKMYEAKLLVPTGTIMSLGIVAPVRLPTGTILPGGAQQLILPKNWPEDWIQGYRRVSGRQLQIVPTYWPERPEDLTTKKEALYPDICPRCCYPHTRMLAPDEQFTIIGSKGTHYTMKRVCLNPNCEYHW